MIYNYLAYFTIYAFLGWVAEVAYAAVQTKEFVNRGFLNGPFCPIYACGALLIVYFLEPIRDKQLLVFLVSILITSIIEFLAGWLLEVIFKKRWWDYSDRNFNLCGYICLEFSVLWGLVSFVALYGLHPQITKLVSLFPQTALKLLITIAYIYIFIDLIATVQNILKLNKKLEEVDKLGKEMRQLSNKLGLKIATNTIDFSKDLEEIKGELGRIEGLTNREEKIEEIKVLLEKRNEILKNKFRTHSRLLKAFPNIKSKSHGYILEEIKKRMRNKN